MGTTRSGAALERGVEQLLEEHPPSTTEAADFWGAQYDMGLAWVDFPVGFGGRGASPEEQEAVDRRLESAGAPSNRFANFVGLGMAARTLNIFADESRRARLLRPLFTCDEIWCQLFSEPGAGSDLASLATRAVRDGDEWIVTGQKVWTTLAHVARWGLLIARTDPDAPKHRGLTYFYVDMQTPGIEVRPLRQITGAADFNEVFLEEVRVPDANRLGAVGDGWRVAMSTLTTERAVVGGLGSDQRNGGPIHVATLLFREHAGGNPVLRDRLAQLWIDAEVLRVSGLRAHEAQRRGAAGAASAVMKLFASHFQQRVYEFCTDVLGATGALVSDYDMVQPTTILESTSGANEADPVKFFLRTRGLTIGGGTTEIARNVVAEQVLGLPTEPRVDKDVPWSQLPRSS